MNIFGIIGLFFVLAGCASTQPSMEIVEEKDQKVLEMQLLLEAEIYAYSGDTGNSAKTYYTLAMQSSNEEVFNKAFVMLTLAKDYDRAKEVVARWQAYYKNRDSEQAQIINEMLRKDYDLAMTAMDNYTITYKEEIYNMVLNFLGSLSEYEKSWFYDELKDRFQEGNLFVGNTLILLGAGKINILLKEQKLAPAQSEMAFLLEVLEKSKHNPNYLAQKQALLMAYLEIDMALDPDIKPENYHKFISNKEKINTFYIKLATNLSLFPDKEKLKLIEQLLLVVARDKNVEENYLQKIESIELAEQMRLYNVLGVYAGEKSSGSKEIYLKNLALFLTPHKKPSLVELRKLQNSDYIFGGMLALEHLVSTKDDKETKRQLDLLVEKFPENRDAIYAEYFNLLQKYGRWSKVIADASWEIEKKKGFDAYTEHLYFVRGIAYSEQKKDDLMEKDFSFMLEHNSKSALALNGWGYTLVERNENLDDAEEMLTEAIKIAPNNIGILDSIGWLAYRKDSFREATTILLKCFQASAEHEIAYHLAKSYLANGEIEKSKKIAYRIWLAAPSYKHLAQLQKDIKEKEEENKEKIEE